MIMCLEGYKIQCPISSDVIALSFESETHASDLTKGLILHFNQTVLPPPVSLAVTYFMTIKVMGDQKSASRARTTRVREGGINQA